MSIIDITQTKLDGVLLSEGVLSYHLRRVKVDKINGADTAVNNDEYVVFRLVTTKESAYGDGKAHLVRHYIDVNYYYSYEKTDARYKDVVARIKAIKTAFLSDGNFRLTNGENDIYDLDNPFRGVNIEFLYIGVKDNG